MSFSPEDYKKVFDVGEFIATFYSDVYHCYHETALKRLHEVYRCSEGAESGLKILEIGCGPVIAYQISAAPFASEIVMADLVQPCRDAVQLWLDKSPNTHDWTPFFRYVVQTLEGKGEEEVARREEQLRKAVKAVIYCNALEDPPVPAGYEGPYDVVLESSLIGAVCKTEAGITAVLVRLSKLLKPGGMFLSKIYLIEGASSSTHPYPGGGTTLANLNISEEMMRTAFTQVGFSDITVVRSPAAYAKDIKDPLLTPEEATYCGVALISAVKVR